MKIANLCIVIILSVVLLTNADASEWALKNSLNLESVPNDIVSANDGKQMYILVPGKVLVYLIPENRVIDFMPVDKKFDHLSVSGKERLFFLSSSKDSTVAVFELQKSINLTGLPFRGPADAPVVVMVFSDYQCPYCGRLEPQLQQVLDKYPKDVKLVFKNFPLSFHSYARKAATAAMAAHDQGKFWEFHHKLFESKSLNDQRIQEIAMELKLDLNRFNKKLKDPAIQRMIDQDLADGRENGVSGTPSILINGKELGERSLTGFSRMIDAELKK